MVNTAAYDGILGNETIKGALAGFTGRGAFPHALIFSGKKGSGKTTFARLAAMSLACRGSAKPCLACEPCRKIAEGVCPDVITVAPPKDRKTLGVDAVRGIRESAYIAPNELEVKVFLIQSAESMTVQAQNALLKLFEEPPKGVYFFLLCSSSAGLLPTVRSRAPELRTELFPTARLKELLLGKSREAAALNASDPDAFGQILRLSEGSWGEAQRLIGSADRREFAAISSASRMIGLLSGGSRGDFLTALPEAATGRESFVALLGLMLSAVRDMTAAKKLKGDFPLLFYTGTSAARAAAAPFTLKGLLDLADVLSEAEERIGDTNVNLQTAAVYFADRMWNVKSCRP